MTTIPTARSARRSRRCRGKLRRQRRCAGRDSALATASAEMKWMQRLVRRGDLRGRVLQRHPQLRRQGHGALRLVVLSTSVVGALNGPGRAAWGCPLLGIEPTCRIGGPNSHFDPKSRTPSCTTSCQIPKFHFRGGGDRFEQECVSSIPSTPARQSLNLRECSHTH